MSTNQIEKRVERVGARQGVSEDVLVSGDPIELKNALKGDSQKEQMLDENRKTLRLRPTFHSRGLKGLIVNEERDHLLLPKVAEIASRLHDRIALKGVDRFSGRGRPEAPPRKRPQKEKYPPPTYLEDFEASV